MTRNSKTRKVATRNNARSGKSLFQNKSVNEFNTTQVVINPQKWVMPYKFRTTLTYYQQTDYSSNTTPQFYQFRGNGPYDPDVTGTGSQPVGFDQMTTFYGRYYVIGSRINIRLVNEGTASLQICLVPSPNSTSYSYDQSIIQPYSKRSQADGTTKGGRSYTNLVNTMATLLVRQTPWDSDLSSTPTANPGLQWYWSITLQSADQASAISCSMQVSIYYDVIFYNPQYVALS